MAAYFFFFHFSELFCQKLYLYHEHLAKKKMSRIFKGKFQEFEEILCLFLLKKVISTIIFATFLCVVTQEKFLTCSFFLLIINKGSLWRKVLRGVSLSCIVSPRWHFPEKWPLHFFPLFRPFLSLFDVYKAFNPSKDLLWLGLRWFAGLKCFSNGSWKKKKKKTFITQLTSSRPPIRVYRKLSNSKRWE